jgi:hypothetical protein
MEEASKESESQIRFLCLILVNYDQRASSDVGINPDHE